MDVIAAMGYLGSHGTAWINCFDGHPSDFSNKVTSIAPTHRTIWQRIFKQHQISPDQISPKLTKNDISSPLEASPPCSPAVSCQLRSLQTFYSLLQHAEGETSLCNVMPTSTSRNDLDVSQCASSSSMRDESIRPSNTVFFADDYLQRALMSGFVQVLSIPIRYQLRLSGDVPGDSSDA